MRIRICDMTDHHLLNTIILIRKMCELQYHYALDSAVLLEGTLNGEAAIDSINREIAQLEERGPDPYEFCSLYESLMDDAYRRGLGRRAKDVAN